MILVNTMRITLIYINTCLYIPLMFFIFLIVGKSILMDGSFCRNGHLFQKKCCCYFNDDGLGSSQSAGVSL